ncbi:MAG: hypothetical protein AAF940_08825 [Pseudomonadota bacterium]
MAALIPSEFEPVDNVILFPIAPRVRKASRPDLRMRLRAKLRGAMRVADPLLMSASAQPRLVSGSVSPLY